MGTPGGNHHSSTAGSGANRPSPAANRPHSRSRLEVATGEVMLGLVAIDTDG